MNVIAILLTLNIVVLFLNIRLSKQFSPFQNIALNLLFIVSVYAAFITQLKTIYLIPLVGVPVYYYWRMRDH